MKWVAASLCGFEVAAILDRQDPTLTTMLSPATVAWAGASWWPWPCTCGAILTRGGEPGEMRQPRLLVQVR